ncbi:TRAP transporter small permease subunit [uncultured Roseibium sp.]|uniref:TRAP transporter small permease n=1 Tax=uncultured Roseibium sp. TaxID=1936171 RepID=UPI0032171A17
MFRLTDRIMNGILKVLGMTLIAMVLLSVVNVISRYIFDKALLWADEIAVLAMIVIAWLGLIICAWRNMEIRMEIVVSALPLPLQNVTRAVQQATITVFCFWATWLSFGYVARVFRFGMTSDSAGIPIWYFHAAVTVSLTAVGLIAFSRVLQAVFAGIRGSGPSKQPKGLET